MRAVLLDGTARKDADLAQLDGVVDLGPGEFLVAIFRFCLAGHGEGSVTALRDSGSGLFNFLRSQVPRYPGNRPQKD